MDTKMVEFTFGDDDEPIGGILVDDKYIICGCCGGVIEVDDPEVKINKILSWINISNEILGE